MAAAILIVEDSKALALTYQAFLEEAGFHAKIAHTAFEAATAVAAGGLDAVLLDLVLPDGDGLALLKDLRARGFSLPVIVVTADTSPEAAEAAVRLGAADFIMKPVLRGRLALTLRNTLEKQSLKTILDDLAAGARTRFCDFIGQSPAMQAVYRTIESAAKSRAPVFITGESGTGKELAARAVHALSDRRARAFEALNCAAIPETLIESEMFGHTRGAFTGAVAAKAGAAARANGGTLFLDEIAEMPVDMQSKLLRFTQTSAFRPVGGQQETTADVRFVSATNRDPAEAVRAGRFRDDLYYRLGVIPVHLPPLRTREGDALLIARELLRKITAEEGRPFMEIAKDAESLILSHPWPGNVRQLENTLRRAVVLGGGDMLKASMIGTQGQDMPAAPAANIPAAPAAKAPAPLTLREIERRAIEDAIDRCGGNILKAARELAVNPSTLHRKRGRWNKSAT